MSRRTGERLARRAVEQQDLIREAAAGVETSLAARLARVIQRALDALKRAALQPDGRFVLGSARNLNLRAEMMEDAVAMLSLGRDGFLLDAIKHAGRVRRLALQHAGGSLVYLGAAGRAPEPAAFDMAVVSESAGAIYQSFVQGVMFRIDAILARTMSQGDFLVVAQRELAALAGAKATARALANWMSQQFAATLVHRVEQAGDVVDFWLHLGPIDDHNVTDIVSANPPGLIHPMWKGYGSRDFIRRVFTDQQWGIVSPHWRDGWLHYNERGVFQPIAEREAWAAAQHRKDSRWMDQIVANYRAAQLPTA